MCDWTQCCWRNKYCRLANIYSCPFIATQDIGKTYKDGSFTVLGRFDNADIRGCNLMME